MNLRLGDIMLWTEKGDIMLWTENYPNEEERDYVKGFEGLFPNTRTGKSYLAQGPVYGAVGIRIPKDEISLENMIKTMKKHDLVVYSHYSIVEKNKNGIIFRIEPDEKFQEVSRQRIKKELIPESIEMLYNIVRDLAPEYFSAQMNIKK